MILRYALVILRPFDPFHCLKINFVNIFVQRHVINSILHDDVCQLVSQKND